MSMKPISILFVDDSDVIIQVLSAIFKNEPDFQIIGVAKNGLEAIEKTKLLKPDVITMDIEMSEMNGIQATKHIMAHTPTPIVILSSHTEKDVPNNAFEALKYGALTVLKKPENILEKRFEQESTKLVKLIKAMSEIHVIKRRTILKRTLEPLKQRIAYTPKASNIIALGASTGGPEALSHIFRSFGDPENINLPIIIVLHIAEGFLPGFIAWLKKEMTIPLSIAEHNETLLPGHIYFAPDNTHLTVKNLSGQPIASLTNKETSSLFKPSIDVLFNSLVESFPNTSVAGLLTGMGKDGAEGLLALYNAKSFTFIQSEASSTIFGMPQQAKLLNAAQLEVDLSDIGPLLARIMYNREK